MRGACPHLFTASPRAAPLDEDAHLQNWRADLGDPIPVGMIAVARYRPGARWRPRFLSAGKAALALFGNAVAAAPSPEECLTAIQSVVAGSLRLQGTRREAAETAERILTACNWAEN